MDGLNYILKFIMLKVKLFHLNYFQIFPYLNMTCFKVFSDKNIWIILFILIFELEHRVIYHEQYLKRE